MSRVDYGVNLVQQAIYQDERQNYREACRLYRESIIVFKQLIRSRSSSYELRDLISETCIQYEQRLRVIERHLLNDLDLTQFLRDVNSERKYESCTSLSGCSYKSQQVYGNPQLAKAMDELQRGKKYDVHGDYQLSYAHYQAGLDLLMKILKDGTVSENQSSVLRSKYLHYHDRCAVIQNYLERAKYPVRTEGESRGKNKQTNPINRKPSQCNVEDSLASPYLKPLDSKCGSEEELLEMEEITGSLSRRSSCQSLDNCSSFHSKSESCHTQSQAYQQQMLTKKSNEKLVKNSVPYKSQQSIHKMDGSYRNLHQVSSSQYSLHQMKGSLPFANSNGHLGASVQSLHPQSKQFGSSVHSLYPQCVIQKYPSTISEISSISETIAPLANMNQEFNLSLQSLREKQEMNEKDFEEEESTSGSIREEQDDSVEFEFNEMNFLCGDNKFDDTASDSGISDPSPDAIIRDSKSPESLTDRKSIMSDISEIQHDQDAYNIIPNVVILSNGYQKQVSQTENFPRRYNKQVSKFQNPDKDILISQMSREQIAVLDQDTLDSKSSLVTQRHRHRELPHHSETRSPKEEHRHIETRSHKENDEVNPGCYMLAAVLDFCWCL